jgi:hypothetical protein
MNSTIELNSEIINHQYVSYSNTFYSSFIFLTNVILNIYFCNYLYAILFINLTIASLFRHSKTTVLTYLFDRASIILVVLYGGYIFYKKIINIKKSIEYFYAFIILITFLSTIFLYHYGYHYNNFCFSIEEDVSQFYHVMMHFLSSIGHHLIAFM